MVRDSETHLCVLLIQLDERSVCLLTQLGHLLRNRLDLVPGEVQHLELAQPRQSLSRHLGEAVPAGKERRQPIQPAQLIRQRRQLGARAQVQDVEVDQGEEAGVDLEVALREPIR